MPAQPNDPSPGDELDPVDLAALFSGSDRLAGKPAKTSSVYEELREEIITGEIPPGTRLTEAALATRFRISRTPIREALRRLEQDGLTERTGDGLRVMRHSPKEILEIYDVRIVLESAAARAAAERATELDLMRLQQIHDQMRKLVGADGETIAALNRRFHGQVWAMSHNAALIDLLSRLSAHVMRYDRTPWIHENRSGAAMAEHEAMLEAVACRDAERSAQAASLHMTAARDTRLRMYAELSTHEVGLT